MCGERLPVPENGSALQLKASVNDIILYSYPVPSWYGTYAATIYALANRLYSGASIDTALISDDVWFIKSDGNLPESMRAIPSEVVNGAYNIATYPVSQLSKLLLEIDSLVFESDEGKPDSCCFKTFCPTDATLASQTNSISDFLTALATYGYDNVDIPLIPLLQTAMLIDQIAQGDANGNDASSANAISNASVTATLCSYYSTFDHRFQAIYYPDIMAKYGSQECSVFFDMSTFIATSMNDCETITIDGIWNAINGRHLNHKNTWTTFVDTIRYPSDSVSMMMIQRLLGSHTKPESYEKPSIIRIADIVGIDESTDDGVNPSCMSQDDIMTSNYINGVVDSVASMPFQLQPSSIPTPSIDAQVLVIESIGGVYPQPASISDVINTILIYEIRDARKSEDDNEYADFVDGVRHAFSAFVDMCKSKITSRDTNKKHSLVHSTVISKSAGMQLALSNMLRMYDSMTVMKLLRECGIDAYERCRNEDTEHARKSGEHISSISVSGGASRIYIPQSMSQKFAIAYSDGTKSAYANAVKSVRGALTADGCAREERTYGRVMLDYIRCAIVMSSLDAEMRMGNDEFPDVIDVSDDDMRRMLDETPSLVCALSAGSESVTDENNKRYRYGDMCAGIFGIGGDGVTFSSVGDTVSFAISIVNDMLSSGSVVADAGMLSRMPFTGAAVALYAKVNCIAGDTCEMLIKSHAQAIEDEINGILECGTPSETVILSEIASEIASGEYTLSKRFIRLVDAIQYRMSITGESSMLANVRNINDKVTYMYATFIALIIVLLGSRYRTAILSDGGAYADLAYPSYDWSVMRLMSYFTTMASGEPSDADCDECDGAVGGNRPDDASNENWHPCKLGDIASMSDVRDMTVEASINGVGSNIIERDRELDQVISVLIRHDKPNPVIIGSAGVGKTAIVELLAWKIVNGDVPQQLRDKRILLLDIAELGTGQIDGIKKVIDYAVSTKSILFIDEFHVVAMNQIVKNMLKPYLSRGQVSVIGATTSSEWQAAILPEKALVRRMSVININEMTSEQVKSVLLKRIPTYETHHGVKYLSTAADTAMIAANAYIMSRRSPDKELDVLDTAGSIACMRGHDAVTSNDIYDAVKTLTSNSNVAPMTNILAESDDDELLEKKIDAAFSDVAGQKKQKMQIARALQTSVLKKNDRPRSVMMFAGPSGVGKTMIADRIPAFLGTNRDAHLTVNMSEYVRDHEYSRLIGAPPGYIGYSRGGILTNFAMEHPDGVVIFDEFEKASSKVSQILLRLFDEGIIESAAGETVDCRSMVFVCTTNAGFDEEHAITRRTIGFMSQGQDDDKKSSDKRKELSEQFGAPMMGRFDEVVFFDNLTADDIREICRIKYDELKDMYQRQCNIDISNVVNGSEVDEIIERNMDGQEISVTGARYVSKQFEHEISERVIGYAKQIVNIAADSDGKADGQ